MQSGKPVRRQPAFVADGYHRRSIDQETSMTPGSLNALDVLRRILGRYSDVAPEQVVPEAELSALQVDSLTLAELLFELEDLVGAPMADPATLPTHVSDLLWLIEPHLAAIARRSEAP